jgi:uncharacterized SAM-binding protein YcdF (DUF218 family)
MKGLIFHKSLPVLILPLGASLLMLMGALRWRKRVLVAIPLVVLWGFGTPAISDPLMRSLENRYRSCAVQQCPQADAVFVFGGMLGPREQPGGDVEWNDGADRFDRALALYLAGRVSVLVLSGGEPRYPGGFGEGELLRRVAVQRGVPNAAIIVIPDADNTAAEADALSEIAAAKHWKRVLLVTSAFHMPRAMRLARRCSAETVPVPVGYQTRDDKPAGGGAEFIYFLPGAEALFQSERALREYLGIAFYSAVRPGRSHRRE